MKKKCLFTLVLLLLVATAAIAQDKGGSTISVKVENLNCSTPLGSGTFNVQSWSFGASNTGDTSGGGGGGAGKATVTDLSVRKKFDQCSPALFGAVTTGKHYKSATLTQEDKKGPVMVVTMSDVVVSSYQLGGSQADRDPMEAVMFNFSKICINDVDSGSSVCFDFNTQSSN